MTKLTFNAALVERSGVVASLIEVHNTLTCNSGMSRAPVHLPVTGSPVM